MEENNVAYISGLTEPAILSRKQKVTEVYVRNYVRCEVYYLMLNFGVVCITEAVAYVKNDS